MPLINSEPIKKFITDGLNTGEFGNDAIQILTEIEYAPPIEAYTPEEIQKILEYQEDVCGENLWCTKCPIGKPCSSTEENNIKNIIRAMKEDPECDILKGE